MKKTIFLILFSIAIFINQALCQEKTNWDEWDVIQGEMIIKFDTAKISNNKIASFMSDELSLELLEKSVIKSYKAQQSDKQYEVLLPTTYIAYFNPSKRNKILKNLEKVESIIYFEPVRKRITDNQWGTSTPNDNNDALWGMKRIGASVAWEKQRSTRADIFVAVCETNRVNLNHEDISTQNGNVHNHPGVIGEHATHVAGTIAATGNNGVGVVGIANIRLSTLSNGNANTTLAQNIAWARNMGVRVINMSFKHCGANCKTCSYAAPSQTEQEAINAAFNRGTLIVCAASNDTCSTDPQGRGPTPASYDNVIAVSALNISDGLASFSNFGNYVDFTAPGVDILSTGLGNNEYIRMQGTSMAAPHVAGSFAAVLSVNPNFGLSNSMFDNGNFGIRSLVRLLTLTAEDIGAAGRDDNFGHGVIRVDRAITAMADAYVDNSIVSFVRTGSLALPHLTLASGIANITNGQTLGFVKGTYSVAERITKPCKLISVNGSVLIKK